MLVARKITFPDAISYIIAQFIGATAAAGALYLIQKGSPSFAMGDYALCSTGWRVIPVSWANTVLSQRLLRRLFFHSYSFL